MKIRTYLTVLFTLITLSLLLSFACIIYFSASQNRETEFYISLEKEAINKANLFFNAQLDAKTLQTIYKNNRAILNEVEVAIYDTTFHLLYHDAVDIDFVKETNQMIEEIRQKNEIRFYQNDWQIVGLKYNYENKNYIITAAAFDQYGYNKLANLRGNIFIVSAFSIILIYGVGSFFSKRVFKPIKDITDRVKVITSTNLDLRIQTNDSKDELAELANTFNEMLNRLENSFDAQKQFVSNISHELRTPLSAIITELELATDKNRTITEYQNVIQHALQDARKLAKLSNSLLDFAKASYDASEIAFKEIRLDEILLDAQQQVIKQNPSYAISIQFENETSDEAVHIHGNEYLLKTAFVNLMENGCKFSPDRYCEVSIFYQPDKAILKFTDKGIGITEKDLPYIFTPFYRGENKKYADGNGIGLSLMQKIIALHKGVVSVISAQQQGTSFKLDIPINLVF